MKRLFGLPAALVLAAFMIGCSQTKTPDDEQLPDEKKDVASLRGYTEQTDGAEVRMSENTVFIKDDVAGSLQSFDPESGRISFANSNALKEQHIKEGDILYSAERTQKSPDGYCLRVVSVKESAGIVTYETEPATALEAIDYLNEKGVLSAGNYRPEDIRVFALPEDDDTPGTKSGSISYGGFSIGSEGVEIKGDKLDFFSDTKVTRFGYILYEHKEPGDDMKASFKIKLTLEMQHELDTEKSNVFLDCGNFILFTMFKVGVSAKLEIGTTLALEKNQESLMSKEQERIAKERLLGKKFKIAEIPLNFTCSKIIVDPKLIVYGEFKLDLSGKLVLEAGIRDGTYAFNLANNGPFSKDFKTNSYLNRVSHFKPFMRMEGRLNFTAMAGFGVGLNFEIPSMPVITEDDGGIAGKRSEPSGIGLYFGTELTSDINVTIAADFFSGNREFKVAGKNGALKLKASVEGKVGLKKKVWGTLDWTFWENELITLPDWDWTWSVWTPTPYDLASVVNNYDATVVLSWKVPDGKGIFNKSAVNIGMAVSDEVSLSPFVGNLEERCVTFGPAADGTYYWNVTTHAVDGDMFPSDTCSFVINASRVATGSPEINGSVVTVPVEIKTLNDVLERGVVYSFQNNEPLADVDIECQYGGVDNAFNMELTDILYPGTCYMRGYALILVDGAPRYIYGNTVPVVMDDYIIQLSLSEEALAFGEVPAGQAKTLTVEIANVGKAAGLVKIVPQYDNLPITFDWCESEFSVGGSASLNVTYAPQMPSGAWTASISIDSYSLDGSFISRGSLTLSGSASGADNPSSEHEAVDLGLSVKWASCNLGASTPEEYGNYYAWGETEPKSEYDWSTYKWGGYNDLTKYCPAAFYGRNGFADNKTVLDLEDDAAHVALGGSWRMPTEAEQDELLERCTREWTSMNGVNGLKVTGPNGNSIFLPAAGFWSLSCQYAGSSGHYWTSSLKPYHPYLPDPDGPRNACRSRFYSSNAYCDYGRRYYGYSVRPVTD